MKRLWIFLKPFANWKFLVAFGLAWFITNGWAWLGLAIGKGWFKVISAGYMAFLWMPFTPEKIVTIPLAIGFQRLLFRKDKKLNQQLLEMKNEAWLMLHHRKIKLEYIYYLKARNVE